jgi:hypothetical protein
VENKSKNERMGEEKEIEAINIHKWRHSIWKMPQFSPFTILE